MTAVPHPIAQMKAVDKVVTGIETALKEISDELKNEKANAANGNVSDDTFSKQFQQEY